MKEKGFILNKKGIHGASSSCLRGRQLPSSGGMRRKPAAERGGGVPLVKDAECPFENEMK